MSDSLNLGHSIGVQLVRKGVNETGLVLERTCVQEPVSLISAVIVDVGYDQGLGRSVSDDKDFTAIPDGSHRESEES